jgi:hypothetical protein
MIDCTLRPLALSLFVQDGRVGMARNLYIFVTFSTFCLYVHYDYKGLLSLLRV